MKKILIFSLIFLFLFTFGLYGGDLIIYSDVIKYNQEVNVSIIAQFDSNCYVYRGENLDWYVNTLNVKDIIIETNSNNNNRVKIFKDLKINRNDTFVNWFAVVTVEFTLGRESMHVITKTYSGKIILDNVPPHFYPEKTEYCINDDSWQLEIYGWDNYLHPGIFYYEYIINKKVSYGRPSNWVKIKSDRIYNQDNLYDFTGFIDLPEEGAYQVIVSATDRLLNHSSEKTYYITLDATAPTIDLMLDPGYESGWKNLSQVNSISAIATDSVSGIQSSGWHYYNINNVYDDENAISNSNTLIIGKDGLLNQSGIYEIVFHAKDNAGNESFSYPVTVKIDNTAPVVSAVNTDTDYVKNPEIKVTFSDAHSGIKALYYKVDNGSEWKPIGLTLPASEYSHTLTGLNDGEHTLSYKVTDEAGNESLPKSVTVYIDNTAPDLNVVNTKTGYVKYSEIKVTFSDAHSGIKALFYKVDNGSIWKPIGLTLPASEYIHTLKGLNDGAHTVSYKVTDKAGNESPPKSVTVFIDNTAGLSLKLKNFNKGQPFLVLK